MRYMRTQSHVTEMLVFVFLTQEVSQLSSRLILKRSHHCCTDVPPLYLPAMTEYCSESTRDCEQDLISCSEVLGIDKDKASQVYAKRAYKVTIQH